MRDSVLQDFGKIDILVNDAGIAGKNAPLVEVSEEEWDRVMAVDLKRFPVLDSSTLSHA